LPGMTLGEKEKGQNEVKNKKKRKKRSRTAQTLVWRRDGRPARNRCPQRGVT